MTMNAKCAWCGSKAPCPACGEVAIPLSQLLFNMAVSALPQVDPRVLEEARRVRAERN